MTTSRAITVAIFKAHHGGWAHRGDQYGGAHPLGGLTVAEWVKEARRGWPRVPVPKDPAKAAQKAIAGYTDQVTYEEIP